MRDAQLPERLFVHYVNGSWRAPLGTRPLRPGDAPGRIIAGDGDDVARALGLMAARYPAPVALLSAAHTPEAALRALLDGLAQGPGVLWKPAPAAAASAHALVQARREALGQGVALIHGDHATGRALAERLPVLWLSSAPVPDARWRVITPDGAATG